MKIWGLLERFLIIYKAVWTSLLFCFVFFIVETESGKQPSISMSQDCSSLDSSTIGPRGDGDSHASLIPGPRSCTVSIASSFDNFNINTCEGSAATPSITEAMAIDDIFDRTSVTNVSHHGSNIDKDSLSVLESVGSNEDDWCGFVFGLLLGTSCQLVLLAILKKLTGVVVVEDCEFYCSAQLKSCDFQM